MNDMSPVDPYNLEAEQALLGAILANNEALNAIGTLDAGDFHEGLHGRIFDAAAKLIRAGKLASAVTLQSYFATDEAMVAIGGPGYLGRLVAGAATVLNAPEYAAIVRDLATRRRLIDTAQAAIAEARNAEPGEPPSGIIDRLRGELATITGDAAEAGIMPAGGAAAEVIAALDADELPTGHPTGIRDLDRRTGGLFPGDLVIIGGRPGMGKTVIGTTIARNCAEAGVPVVLFSYEMPRGQIMQRIMCDMAWNRDQRITFDRFRRQQYEDARFTSMERDRLREVADELRAVPLFVIDRGGNAIDTLRAQLEFLRWKLAPIGREPRVVVVDYLNLLAASDRYRGSKVNEVGEISAKLKRAALDLGVAIVALQQLNRAVESREDHHPVLSDLRDSGNLEQDADAVMFLYRRAYYLERKVRDGSPEEAAEAASALKECEHTFEISIAKNRHGSTGIVKAYCDIGCSVIRDADLYRAEYRR